MSKLSVNYFKYISMLNQGTSRAKQSGKQREILSLHVKDGEGMCSLGKVLCKPASLSPSTHGRSNRDDCWQESEYLKRSCVVRELTVPAWEEVWSHCSTCADGETIWVGD